MNHSGDDLVIVPTLPPAGQPVGGNGRQAALGGEKRALAIVGSHPATRELAPWDDERFEIWLMNEAAQKPEVYKRWDAVIQIHGPEVYTSPTNWVNASHWEWLQQDHGTSPVTGRRRMIWMQTADPRVPNAVEYPLAQILKMTPYHYLRSSPAMALALAIWLNRWDEIWLYGSELSSNTEYAYQATNYAFWIGFAHGKGIDVHLECWQGEFFQRIYGYEGELQIDRAYYLARAAEVESAWKTNENALEKMKSRLAEAMLEHKYDKVGDLSVEIENAALAAGETFGILSEARRYAEREDMISRQEFERTAAKARDRGDEIRTEKDKAFGKCEYVWNAWKQSGSVTALNQLRKFVAEKTQLAYECGVKFGVFNENMAFLAEFDRRLEAAGGVRALGRPEEYRVPVK